MSDISQKNEKYVEQQLYAGGQGMVKRFAYGSGEFVYNLPWMLVSSFLAFFMTDIALVPAAAVSVLFLVCRVWDAVNDPLIGSLSDNTKSKFGRYRIWMLVGGLIYIPIVILNFWAHPDWSVSARTAYACILYFIVVIFSTSWNIPFSALGAVISPYPRERAGFASVRILCSSIACGLSTAMFLPLVANFSGADGSGVTGAYLKATAVVCLIALPFVFTAVFGTKEAIQAPPKQKFTTKQMIESFTKNRPLMIIVVGFLVYGFVAYGRMTVAVYYFTYIWGNPNLFTLYATINGFVSGIAAFFCVYIVRLFRGKKNAMLVAYGASTIMNVIIYFFMPESGASAMTVVVLLWVAGALNGVVTGLIYGMIGDACDFGQWKTHLRADGLCSSGTSFALKLGGAISPTLLMALLASTGYVAGAEVQTAGAITSMNVVMNLIPAVLSLISFVLFFFYNLTEEKHAQILKELEERGELIIDK